MTFLQDARYAWRSLWAARGYALVTVLTLALGIGGTTSIFSVVRAATAPPAYPAADRLVHIWGTWPGGAGSLGYPDFRAMLQHNASFEQLAAYEPAGGVAMTGVSTPVLLNPNFVTADYLRMLGAKTLAGRLFEPAENELDSARPVVIVGETFWRQQLSADPNIINRALSLNNHAYTVVGVIRSSFRDLGLAENGPQPDVWLPAASAQQLLGQPPLTNLYSIYFAVGLLKPGVTLSAAGENLKAVSAEVTRQFPALRAGYVLNAQPIRDRVAGPVRQPALMLLVGAVLILALGCFNLASASLVRLGRRRGEMALRAALGATPQRLLRQLMIEAGLMAIAGSVAGLLTAIWLTNVLALWVRAHVTALIDVRVDGAVLVCAAILTVATTVLVGLIPAFQARSVDLRTALGRNGTRGSTGRRSPARQILIVGEIALSMTLLVAAGLMARSVYHLVSTSVGYDSSRLLTLRLDLNGDRYGDQTSRSRFWQALDERLRAVPGVETVTLWGPSMLSNATWVMSVFPAERVAQNRSDFLQVFRHSMNPGALAHLGIPLLAGREIDAHDTAETPRVGVISNSVARQLWPNENPIGKKLQLDDPARPPITVIGVAADAMQRDRYDLAGISGGYGPGAVGPQRDIYFSFAQSAPSTIAVALRMNRGGADPDALATRARAAIAELDRDLPVNDVRMLDDRLNAQVKAPAAIAGLFLVFALFALFLSALGVYGVIAQSVDHRARELGLRLALGATPQLLLGRIVGGALSLACLGALFGAIGATAMSRSYSALLVDVGARDRTTFAVVAAILLCMAASMSLIPAWRVIRRGPLQATRE